jgi:hypothetical protein
MLRSSFSIAHDGFSLAVLKSNRLVGRYTTYLSNNSTPRDLPWPTPYRLEQSQVWLAAKPQKNKQPSTAIWRPPKSRAKLDQLGGAALANPLQACFASPLAEAAKQPLARNEISFIIRHQVGGTRQTCTEDGTISVELFTISRELSAPRPTTDHENGLWPADYKHLYAHTGLGFRRR